MPSGCRYSRRSQCGAGSSAASSPSRRLTPPQPGCAQRDVSWPTSTSSRAPAASAARAVAKHSLRRHGLVVALDERDGAERAAAVAAVGDLDVGAHGARPPRHPEGGPPAAAARPPLVPAAASSSAASSGAVSRPHQRSTSGISGSELVAVALDEAAHCRHAGAAGVRAARRHRGWPRSTPPWRRR